MTGPPLLVSTCPVAQRPTRRKMCRTAGSGKPLVFHVIPLTVLALLLLAGVTAAAVGSGHAGSSGVQAEVTIDGNWKISSQVSYSNTSLVVNGSITIESGGSLTLQNVTLSLAEPTGLANGLVIENGGALSTTASTIESSVPANHLWVEAESGAHLSVSGGAILDLGGPDGTNGFVVNAAGASFNGVTFNDYYEALVVSATDVTVEDCAFESTTSTVNSTWVVSTSGASSGFVMTHSRMVDTSMLGGALFVASASDIENNTFTLDPRSTNPTPILIGYSGIDGWVNASGSRFAYNTVSGGDVTDLDSSNVNISHNRILNTGGKEFVHDSGVLAYVFDPSGHGIWISGLTIEDNFISNSTSFGIRVSQNVTDVLIAHNTITNISTDPQAGVYGGLETYEGIYLIRGVTHALVEDNVINESADQENPTVGTAGIGLESEVDYTTVANNTVLNTQLGIWVQGDWDDGAGNIGPSLHNTVTGNTFRNTLPIVETTNLPSAIQNYQWANYTTISNNLIEGWNLLPSGVSSDAILQADDYGTIEGNVVDGATSGVVLGYFYGAAVSNGSENVIYGNSFPDTSSAIVDDTASNPGPIVNVVNVLTPHPTSSGFPTADLESIGRATGVGFSESSGNFSATLQTHSPVTGEVENFTTSIPWAEPDFSVQMSGDLGSGTVGAHITSLNSTKVTYSVSPEGTLYDTVSLSVPSENYSAAYTVSVVAGPDSQTFTVDSSTGPAAFETNWTGTLSVTVILDSWTAITTTNSTVDLQLSVTTPGGNPVPGVLVQVGLDLPSQSSSVMLGPTDGTGGATLSGLPMGTSIANLTLEASGYTLGSYSVVTPRPDLIQLNVVVVPGESVENTTTYQVRFTELGLTAGTPWWVSLTGPEPVNVTLSGISITFNLPSGTYHYALGALTGANTTAAGGMFVLPDGTATLVVNANFTPPGPSGSGPPPSGTTPSSSPFSLPSWAVAFLYLFVAAFEVGLVFGMYRMFRSEAPGAASRPARTRGRRGRTRPRER